MHPDVRAAAPGKCPICAMDLVPIPPPRVGQYHLELDQTPGRGGRGLSRLSLRIRDPHSAEPVTVFVPLHERPLHLFIISRDLKFFAHEHPVQHGDRFDLAFPLKPGAYMVLADFLPASGNPQMVHSAMVTAGFTGTPFPSAPAIVEDRSEKTADGMRIGIAIEHRPMRLDAVLRFAFTDAVTAAPIRDLQPYLGASGHLLLVSPDLTHAVHAHPQGDTAGPDISFEAEFPVAGLYKMWVQVQRRGRVTTVPFVIGIGHQTPNSQPPIDHGRRRKWAFDVDVPARPIYGCRSSLTEQRVAGSASRRLPAGSTRGDRRR